MRTTRRLIVVALGLGLAGCASDWTFVGARDHEALRPGTQLATFERGRGAERERRVEIRAGGADVPAARVDDLMPHVLPIDTAEAAIAYADLVRDAGVGDAGARGVVVRPDPSLQGTGDSGRYSRSDASAWGVDFRPTTRPYGGGFEVSHVVLYAPIAHPDLPRAATPWRLVLVREVVLPDGTIRWVGERTLTNGRDAARFSAF